MKDLGRFAVAAILLAVVGTTKANGQNEGLSTPPRVSAYGGRLAGGAAQPTSARTRSTVRLDLSGVWLAPSGWIVFADRLPASDWDTYTARATRDGEEQVLTASFDGRRLRLRIQGDERRPALGQNRVGFTQILSGGSQGGGLETPKEDLDPKDTEGVYDFNDSGPEIFSAITAVDFEGSTPFSKLRRPLDSILHLGMNPGSAYEVQRLRELGAEVVVVANKPQGIKSGGRTYDLDDWRDSREVTREFVRSLGLPAPQQTAVYTALMNADFGARDELGQLAVIWAAAERGEALPSRMIISGHHVGSSVWGDDNGSLSWSALGALADALPRGAAQVEDLHLAACYTGGPRYLRLFTQIFPNLRTFWAYEASAPGAVSGAEAHQRYWEKGTRGAKTEVREQAAKLVQKRSRKARSIYAVVVGGVSASNGSLRDLVRRIFYEAFPFEGYMDGDRIANSQHGPLRSHYDLVQRALQHPDVERSTVAEQLILRRDRTIRLLYYSSHIAPKFAREYQSALRSGYATISRPVPDFGALSRYDALEEIRTVTNLLNADPDRSDVAAETYRLLMGLRSLDPRVIPETWV